MGRNLKTIAFAVAIVGTAGVNLAQIITQRLHRSRDYCQLPFKVLNENPQALELLGGEPVRIINLDLRQAKFDPLTAKLVMPVLGKKRGGLIYTLSTRPDKDSKWTLQYAVMKIDHEKYRWNVWLHPDDGMESNTDLLPDDVQKSLL